MASQTVTVDEFLAVDWRNISLDKRPNAPISAQSAHRFVHNPLHNFVTNVLSSFRAPNGKSVPSRQAVVYLPNAHILLPECDICGYLSIPLPQYTTSVWLTAARSEIGIAKNLPATTLGYTGEFSQIGFRNCTKDPLFSNMLVYSTFATVNLSKYFTATAEQRRAKFASIAEALSDENYGAHLKRADRQDQNEQSEVDAVESVRSVHSAHSVQSVHSARSTAGHHDPDVRNNLLQSLECLWPSDFLTLPPGNHHKITHGLYSKDVYPQQILPYGATFSETLRFGREFTNIEFPPGYGIQLSMSDLIPYRWYWSTEHAEIVQQNLKPGEQVALHTVFTLVPDWKALYQALFLALADRHPNTSRAEISQHVEGKAREFGFPPPGTVKSQQLQNLYVTWLGTGDLIAIPAGRSRYYGKLAAFPTSVRFVSVIPYCGDHTLKTELWAEKGPLKKKIYTFVPRLGKGPAAHLAVARFLEYGPLTEKYPLHDHVHDRNHLQAGSLQSCVDTAQDGWIIKNHTEILFRVKAYYHNTHKQPIDNLCTCGVYWVAHAIPGRVSSSPRQAVRSTTEQRLVCAGHLDSYSAYRSESASRRSAPSVGMVQQRSKSRSQSQQARPQWSVGDSVGRVGAQPVDRVKTVELQMVDQVEVQPAEVQPVEAVEVQPVEPVGVQAVDQVEDNGADPQESDLREDDLREEDFYQVNVVDDEPEEVVPADGPEPPFEPIEESGAPVINEEIVSAVAEGVGEVLAAAVKSMAADPDLDAERVIDDAISELADDQENDHEEEPVDDGEQPTVDQEEADTIQVTST